MTTAAGAATGSETRARPARRRCGDSDLVLPVLGVGCWSYGGGDYWGPQGQADVDAVVRAAVERGYGFFDTAESYNAGESERSLGRALRGVRRDRAVVCTKVSPANVSPASLEAHCEASLGRLGTDCVDLYMVHWPVTPHAIRHFTDQPVEPLPTAAEVFGGLDRLRRAGKVRHVGVSNFGVARLAEALATGVPVVADELPYGLLTRAIEREVLPFCRANGVGAIGYMSLLQGALSDRYADPTDLPPMRRRTRHFDAGRNPLCRHGMPGAEAETRDAVRGIRAVARRLGVATADLALRWAFAGPGITSCLCGSRNVVALEQNIAAAEAPPLPADVSAELDRVTRPLADALGDGFDYYENPSHDRTL